MHPVLDLLAQRAATGSAPGARAPGDDARLALVLEGGGMRGVVSCAMAAAIERLGLTRCFDLVVGTSAGALNAAALLAGSAETCLHAYSGAFAGRMFINPWRLIAGRAAVDVNRTLDFHEEGGLDAERHARTLANPIELHCVAVDVETAGVTDLHGFTSLDEQRGALLASSRLPWIGGPPVRLADGRRYLDGGLADPIPVDTAERAGATHVLALQTRPEGVPRASPGGAVDRLIERRLRALNPDLIGLYRQRTPQYEAITEALAARTAAANGGPPPHAFGIRPPAGTPVVSQLERKPAPLAAAGRAALEHAEALLRPLAAAP